MKKTAKIFVAGHQGLVGSALIRALKQQDYQNIITRSRAELDLTQQISVSDFFAQEKPEYVFLAAAKVGGIWANNHFPADFIYQNLLIQNNVMSAAKEYQVKRLLFLGSSCIYPRECPQPIKEEYLLTGLLEPTNRPYALAKIAGIEMCSAFNRQYGTKFLAVMPTNLYGPGDNYDLHTSHVIPALIRKMHEAKINGQSQVVVWGTGTPKREFLYSDDLANACLFLMQSENESVQKIMDSPGAPIVNIGWGEDLTILELAQLIAEIVGFQGEVVFDRSKPDGTPRKVLCIDKMLELGWKAQISLPKGIEMAYQAFLGEQKQPIPENNDLVVDV